MAKLKWASNGVFLTLKYTAFIFLVLVPMYLLLWKWVDGSKWVIQEIYNNVTYNENSTLSTMDWLMKVLISLFWIIAIGFIYFAPSIIKNPMDFATNHIAYTLNKVKAADLKNKDKEKYNAAIFKITSYGLIWVGLFATYYFLIHDIISPIVQSTASLPLLIGVLAKAFFILLIWTMAIMFIEGFDPAPEYKNGELDYDKEKIDQEIISKADASNGVAWALILLAAIIIAISISSGITALTVKTIDNTINWQNSQIINETGAWSLMDGWTGTSDWDTDIWGFELQEIQ